MRLVTNILNSSLFTIVMSEHLVAWIRKVATLSDTALEEELKLINKNSINAFARAVGRIRRPEVDSHTFRSGGYEAHPHADTINLLLSGLVHMLDITRAKKDATLINMLLEMPATLKDIMKIIILEITRAEKLTIIIGMCLGKPKRFKWDNMKNIMVEITRAMNIIIEMHLTKPGTMKLEGKTIQKD